jgi:hypothetical protein
VRYKKAFDRYIHDKGYQGIRALVAFSYNGSDKKWHAEMNANADQLKAAPEYKYPSNS